MMCFEKQILNMFRTELRIGFLQQSWVPKTLSGLETHLLSFKVETTGLGGYQESHSDSFLKDDRINHYSFP